MIFPAAQLTDRGVVAATGPDAEKLLQGLVTNDVAGLAPGEAAFAGLLSPQGKILFDFFIVQMADGFLLDVARDKAAELAKKLTIYRLRSEVAIADRSDHLVVYAQWLDRADDNHGPETLAVFADPRLPALGRRRIVKAAEAAMHVGQARSEDAYHAHRIALGVPEGGRDYTFGDTFPHEALYDQLNGVSFVKGCYVGQEIVSRMQHRGTARKRIVKAHADAPLPAAGTPIMAGNVEIGTLGSASGHDGLSLVRLDRAAEFKAKGVPLAVGDVALSLAKPAFATFEMDPQSAASQS